MDFLFDNIVILIGIVAAILGLFNRGQDSEKESTPPIFTPNKQETKNKPIEVSKKKIEDTVEKVEDITIDTSNEWYDQLEKTREKLEKSEQDQKLNPIKSRSIYHKDQTVSNISIKNNLNQTRLIESLIMSDVLGSPKSKRK